MAKNLTGDEVESVKELSEGEEVYVSGNGMNVAAEVTDVSMSSWSQTVKADLEMANGYRVTLSGSDGIHCRQGAVTVERVSDE
jgi:hypothetical protein